MEQREVVALIVPASKANILVILRWWNLGEATGISGEKGVCRGINVNWLAAASLVRCN